MMRGSRFVGTVQLAVARKWNGLPRKTGGFQAPIVPYGMERARGWRMSKIIEISVCGSCFFQGWRNNTPYCSKQDEALLDIDVSIPIWCPLPDSKPYKWARHPTSGGFACLT